MVQTVAPSPGQRAIRWPPFASGWTVRTKRAVPAVPQPGWRRGAADHRSVRLARQRVLPLAGAGGGGGGGGRLALGAVAQQQAALLADRVALADRRGALGVGTGKGPPRGGELDRND